MMIVTPSRNGRHRTSTLGSARTCSLKARIASAISSSTPPEWYVLPCSKLKQIMPQGAFTKLGVSRNLSPRGFLQHQLSQMFTFQTTFMATDHLQRHHK